jgi:subtilase family serine protease
MYGYMLSDGYARVFTTSWSCTEIYSCSTATMDSRHGIFNSMIGQGWTLFAASGDRGASDDCNFESPAHTSVAYPGSDPDVISAGGTTLYLFSNGTYNTEVAWQGGTYTGACKANNGGSGGGCSTYYAAPGWQTNQPCGSGSRAVPDLSLNANFSQNYYYNGALSGFGGTSMVAPELAGFAAQENAYLLSLGNICGVSVGTNPRLSLLRGHQRAVLPALSFLRHHFRLQQQRHHCTRRTRLLLCGHWLGRRHRLGHGQHAALGLDD